MKHVTHTVTLLYNTIEPIIYPITSFNKICIVIEYIYINIYIPYVYVVVYSQ